MDVATRKTMTAELARLTTETAAAMRPAMLAKGRTRTRAEALHREEQVGDPYEVWTDLLSRRAAVLWVLKSLYVRVLEDRGLLRPLRLVDAESEQLFERLAPNLGDTAYLRWIYRDLACAAGGLAELFAPQPAELAPVPDAMSRKLIEFWRRRDPDTHALRFTFTGEHFDGRLMGDLYQDLDPVVKKRYALLQTPDFVLDFILDETLTPALAEWGAETVRVLDPACGSGHFLLTSFKRLVAALQVKQPQRPIREVVQDALRRVVGIDLNDYACALARARLVMTALELCGEQSLAAARDFHPQVFWADALEQIERDEQLEMSTSGKAERPMALLTRPEVRAALRPVLKLRFHVVIANPPYITEKDARKRGYHKEKIGGEPRYKSAYRLYSLGCPFTERMLQLATTGGWIGEITADSFMKREFGKALIEKVLATRHLVKVISTAGAFIPGHGTPTVILILRGDKRSAAPVRVVMGKRAEPGRPVDPAQGRVWRSIVELQNRPGQESEFISVVDLPPTTLASHPWSIGGGGAAELKVWLDIGESAGPSSRVTLGMVATTIGFGCITKQDDVFLQSGRMFLRSGIPDVQVRDFVEGESVRDWGIATEVQSICPYDDSVDLKPAENMRESLGFLWGYRTVLYARSEFGGLDYRTSGRKYYEFGQIPVGRNKVAKIGHNFAIVYGEVATHNHFSLDRKARLFGQTAPMIRLVAAEHPMCFTVLAQLNAVTACFWLKQVCQSKSGSGMGRGIQPEDWMERFQFDSTKLGLLPLAARQHPQLEAFARELDCLATTRMEDSVRSVLDTDATNGPGPLRVALGARHRRDLERLFKMVGLQEELDWLCYRLYGVDSDAPMVRPPDDTPQLTPGLRPFEVTLAIDDLERREAIERGEEPDELPTAWFTRHGWDPHTTLDALPEAERAIIEARLERTQASRELALLEQPTYKRRWYRPKHDEEEREAMDLWLADHVEAWAKTQDAPFTTARAAASLRSDPAVQAVGELLSNRHDFDLDELIATCIRRDAVPNNKHHIFKPEGLLKRAAWEETWRQQHREDKGEKLVPPVPPKYDRADYLKAEYWALRGKLDVPKERFIAFSEVPAEKIADGPLYGWAGWTPRMRARQLLALDVQLVDAGVPVPDRYGLLYSADFLLPYVEWESPTAARDLRSEIRAIVGEAGVSDDMLRAWAESILKPGARAPRAPRKPRTPKAP
jgi:hypothetical protein